MEGAEGDENGNSQKPHIILHAVCLLSYSPSANSSNSTGFPCPLSRAMASIYSDKKIYLGQGVSLDKAIASKHHFGSM